ncbi:hypothetical protein MKX01_007161, partial [Papaver californicum]
EYYFDFIAEKLGVADASWTIGKFSSEMRLYFSPLGPLKSDSTLIDFSYKAETLNLRASIFLVKIFMEMQSWQLLDSAIPISSPSLKDCGLKYSINLLGVQEPLKDRMEQAFFSPPLSRHRIEYAVKHINESCAATLADLGCRSGALLDSLLDYPTVLEKIVGVDIFRKSLTRAGFCIGTPI